MENYMLYKSNSIQFISLFFKIFLGFIFLIFLLIVFLKVNDSVPFNEATIYSKNPKIKIHAPTQVTIKSIKVKEGQDVKKGDTLIILQNKKVQSEYNSSNTNITTAKEKVVMLEKMISIAEEKKKIYQNQVKIKSDMFLVNKASLKNEVLNTKNRIDFAEQQLVLTKSKYKADSILYAKGVISKREFENQQKNIIKSRKLISEEKSVHNKKRFQLKNLANENNQDLKNFEKLILDIDQDIDAYNLKITNLKGNLETTKYNLEYIEEKKDHLIIRSPINGSIPYLFNTKYSLETLPKDALLVIVAPKKEHYYAKIKLDEKNLIYVKKNQLVNFKIDAYNYYKFGGIQGRISYISTSEIDGDFYCIVDFKNTNKNINLKADYHIQGTIIINELSIYEFVFKKLFQKI